MDPETASVLSKRSNNGESMPPERSSKLMKGQEMMEVSSDADGLSNQERLEALIAAFYPQYARLRFIPIRVEAGDRTGRSGTASEPEAHWRCKVYIFEMYIECREVFISFDEAREAAAKLALDLLTEFNRVIRSRSGDSRFGRLLQPLVEQMTAGLAKSSLDAEEQAAVDLGHKPVLSVEQYKNYGSLYLQKSVLSASLSAIYEKMSSAGINTAAAKTETPVPAPRKTASAQPVMGPEDQLADPLSAIHMHCQRRGGAGTPPEFQVFEGKTKLLFGCIGKYEGKSYIAEGVHRTKKEAKRAAAILICQDLFGLGGTLASGEAVAAGKSVVDPVPAQMEPVEPASALFGEEPPKGKRFVSLVNECCQVHHLNQPDYQCKTGDSISNYFIIHALNPFDPSTLEQMGARPAAGKELPRRFVSAACTKKMDAKEDCAGRIFAFLREQGVFDASGNLVRREAGRMQRSGYQGQQPRARYYEGAPTATPQQMAPPRFSIPALPAWPPALPQLAGLPPMPPLPFPLPMQPGMLPMMPPPLGMAPPPFPMFFSPSPPPPPPPSLPVPPQQSPSSDQQTSAPPPKVEDPRQRPR